MNNTNYQLCRYIETPDTTAVLNIRHQRYDDPELEKTRNRFPLSNLLEVNPQNYQVRNIFSFSIIFRKSYYLLLHINYTIQDVRFTCEATIYKINTI